jgi:HEAT repeat protein
MRLIMNNRPELTRFVRSTLRVLFPFAAFTLGQPFAHAADPVDDLKQALTLRLEEPTPAVLDYRRNTLQKKIDGLTNIGELRRALALEEWKDNQKLNESIAEIDADMRRKVGTRLTKAIQHVVKNGTSATKIAVANSIAEMGPTIRSVGDDKYGYARSLTPEVELLAADKDLGVRQEALRALGNIFPEPRAAVLVLKNALEKDAAGPQRLAADGMGQLIRVVSHLKKRVRTATGVEADQRDVLDTVVAVLGANNVGLRSADPQVRALCLQNVQIAAEALADLISAGRSDKEGFPQKELPPEDRPLTPAERKKILAAQDKVADELKELAPAIDALRAQATDLTRSLGDPESRVRLAAVDALENIGNARVLLKKRVLSVPQLKDMEKDGDRGLRKQFAEHDALEAFLGKNLGSVTKLLGEQSVELRRKAVAFLDIIEDAAAPALPLLTESLNDPDRFVRWSAARAIGNIPPSKAAAAVPGLAKLLSDPDLNVRLQAAKTLTEIGPAAHLAVPSLAQAVTTGDAEARLGAMEALQSIGPKQGKDAVPNLIQTLSNPDARVRRMAAKTLGDFGPDARSAVPALRHALGDEDQEVRVNSSDAILNILQRPGEKY